MSTSNTERLALLKGRNLDWAFSTASGLCPKRDLFAFGSTWRGWHEPQPGGKAYRVMPYYHKDWDATGPILQQYKYGVHYDTLWEFDPNDPDDNGDRWVACTVDHLFSAYGSTPLEAVLRLHVYLKLDPEIEIPEV